MVKIRPELAADRPQREALLDRAFGRNRHRKTSARLRDSRLPAEDLAFSATDAKGRLLCEGKAPAEGNLILQASTSDPAGNRATIRRLPPTVRRRR